MFRAIGLVIGLIAVRLLLPTAFGAFEDTAVQFFSFTGEIFEHPPTAMLRDLGQSAGVGYVPEPAPLPESYKAGLPLRQQMTAGAYDSH